MPAKNPLKDDKKADRVAQHNPKVYDGKYDLMELEEWIKGMEKIFIVVEVLDEKKVNSGMFYLIGKDDIWSNTVKDMLLGPEFT